MLAWRGIAWGLLAGLAMLAPGFCGGGSAYADDSTSKPPVQPPAAAAEDGKLPPCTMAAPCVLPEGRYMVKVPTGWDGKSPLATVVWFHGYQQSSTEIMEDSELGRQFSRQGVLMIVPDGRDGTWTFPAGPVDPNGRDDTAFIGAVIADAETRFPIDKEHLFAAGFSIGATMVWTEACEVPARFSAYVAFSGDFWEPLPKSCAAGPVRLLQIHGTADGTFPIHGRRMSSGKYAQGDALKGLDLWRQWKSCPAFGSVAAPLDGLTATATDTCADGSRFAFWQHTRGHEVDPAWVLAAIDWVKHGWDPPMH